MGEQPIPNHPGNYSWKTDASEIRLSYTEMVKGEADIVLAYYQTAIIVRQPEVVVRRDTVDVPPPITDIKNTMPVPSPTASVTELTKPEDDQSDAPTKMISLGEVSVQGSTDLKEDGFKSIGFGVGGYTYDPSQEWIKFYINGFFNVGKLEKSSPGTIYDDGYKAKATTTSLGARLGIGLPETNVVLFGMIEFFKTRVEATSGPVTITGESDGYENSFGGGIKVFVDPSKSGVSFGIEYSELRRLGVSIGVTF